DALHGPHDPAWGVKLDQQGVRVAALRLLDGAVNIFGRDRIDGAIHHDLQNFGRSGPGSQNKRNYNSDGDKGDSTTHNFGTSGLPRYTVGRKTGIRQPFLRYYDYRPVKVRRKAWR